MPGPGGVLLGPGGVVVCLVLGGSPWPQGGGGGVPGQGEFSLVPGGGGGVPGRGGSPETPPVNRITDTCNNITLATTSLRPVTIFTTRAAAITIHYRQYSN